MWKQNDFHPIEDTTNYFRFKITQYFFKSRIKGNKGSFYLVALSFRKQNSHETRRYLIYRTIDITDGYGSTGTQKKTAGAL